MLRYKINKISEISKDQLSSFYKRVYNKRYKSLVNNWRWWYRAERSEFETLVLSIEDKIIGQAGVLPIDLKVGRNQIPAIWFVDFAILTEFQGKGFGQIFIHSLVKILPNPLFLNSGRITKSINHIALTIFSLIFKSTGSKPAWPIIF